MLLTLQENFTMDLWKSYFGFLAKGERITLRLLNAVAIPSVCLLSVVCDVGAPYSGG